MRIGIDLGTTNSALAFIDPEEALEADFPPIRVLDIPQHVAAGRVESLRTLPSFLYLGDQSYVGAYAREQGALVPTRSVHSAKSWLSNPDVDRNAKILPWDTEESARELSPVEVSARFLSKIREAWDAKHPALPLADQDIVLTVPASFDEEARELTVAAAAQAGLENVTLIEEPAAAFYSWIANHLAASNKSLFDGMTVLICDVGGGTSDFTIIRVSRVGDRVEFTRTSVGRHLLLGGDNLDLTLGWLVENKLGKPLSIRQRSGLRRQCAAAKEKLLSVGGPETAEITVLGSGSSLVGGTMRCEITKAEALELALDGFLPFCELSEKPQEEKRSVFREIGLPYVSDPAVTRHLAAFLTSSNSPAPDAILFNGGFFIPEVLRDRVTDVIDKWYGKRPIVFENQDLDLAVAVGAAYYSHVRQTGAGVLVRGGLPRAYFVEIGGESAGTTEEGRIRSVCLAPRGTEEGSTLEVDLPDLQLIANKPVSFRLYSSLTRTEDKIGDVVDFAFADTESGELHAHAPLNAVIRFGKPGGERLVPVKLGAKLTAVGTLEIWCESKVSEHRWRLQFELRKKSAARQSSRPAAVVSEESVVAAEALIDAVFLGDGSQEELPSKLEQTLALGRNSWPLGTLRRLSDRLLQVAEGRRRSAGHELRWLSISGLCLRPGFGFPGDDLRMEQARRVYASGLQFANQIQNEIEWWVFWGRVAGGLNRNQQTDLYQRASGLILPRGPKKARVNSSLLRELWRTASSLELLPAGTRADLGDALIRRVKAGDYKDSELWCLSRIGSRRLFYGPVNQVLSPSVASRWIDPLLKIQKSGEALAYLAQHTGNVTLDVPAATHETVRQRLVQDAAPERLLALLSGEGSRDLDSLDRMFGEDLPGGLVFSASGTEPSTT